MKRTIKLSLIVSLIAVNSLIEKVEIGGGILNKVPLNQDNLSISNGGIKPDN